MAVPFPSNSMLLLCLAIPLMISFPMFASAANFYDNFYFVYGDGRGKIQSDGQREILSLTLDQGSGSGFQSKKEYLFGKIDMQLKLVPGNSAGTVTTYYLTSQGDAHDEIDFEFLGNLTGDPYTLHTNVFSQGKGDREQQFRLWFDPSADFHTYTILWNPKNIIFYVDGAPIREFKNLESKGIPYPKNQPMKLISTIWSADDWATRGGSVKTDWSQAPFTTTYTNFNENACVTQYGTSNCGENANQWLNLELDETSRQKMRETQANHMIYNYCTDAPRFPQGFPPECQATSACLDLSLVPRIFRW